MKAYTLQSFDSGPTYFVKQTSEGKDDVCVILNVEELIPHAEYKIRLIDPVSYRQEFAIIHGSLLNTNNLTIIAINFMDGDQNILQGIEE